MLVKLVQAILPPLSLNVLNDDEQVESTLENTGLNINRYKDPATDQSREITKQLMIAVKEKRQVKICYLLAVLSKQD